MEAPNNTLFSLHIDPVTKSHLTETARWARFLSLLGMVMLILLLVVALMSTTVFTRFFGFPTGVEDELNTVTTSRRVGIVIGVVITSAITFFPLLFLFRFATAMKRALLANDQLKLNTAFQNLKVYFRYLGIVVIIFLVLYGIIIAIGVMGVAASR